MSKPKLEFWSLVYTDLGYKVPGERPFGIVGTVTGHPIMADGKRVLTSDVVEIDIANNRAKTKTGTEYELGKQDYAYRNHMEFKYL